MSDKSLVDSYKPGGSNFTAGSGSNGGVDMGPEKPKVETVAEALARKLQSMHRAKKESSK